MEKRNIRLELMYEGTKYMGWQRLGNSDQTIQGKLEQILSRMTNEDIDLIGVGRTDAGVHAYQYYANFHTNCMKSTDNIKEYLNKYLPQDITVIEVTEVAPRFHSRFNVKDRTYVYRIWHRDYHPVFERNYVVHIPDELDIDKMKKAAEQLIGEYDFKGFASRTSKKSTIRNVKEILIEKTENEIRFYITANGFLYNMVRNIVGTLIEIGLGNREISTIKEILSSGKRELAGERAPAKGLTLYRVNYD